MSVIVSQSILITHDLWSVFANEILFLYNLSFCFSSTCCYCKDSGFQCCCCCCCHCFYSSVLPIQRFYTNSKLSSTLKCSFFDLLEQLLVLTLILFFLGNWSLKFSVSCRSFSVVSWCGYSPTTIYDVGS